MKARITLLALAALAALIGVSIWASSKIGIGAAIGAVVADPAGGTHPWFVATLFDTYFAFLWFWAWVAYRESSNLARGIWLVLIFGLGNIAMAAYVLLQLRTLPANATAQDLLLRRA
jgi:Protein of unknown function (DUF1475)